MTTRTRFAPSPTGFLHLGNIRTALFAYLFAKNTAGQFVLRIEDTDQERLAEGSEAAILEDLKWLGLEWDEGPEVGGPVGPYRCSERYDLYQQELKRVQKLGRVYRCFCSPEQLDKDRALLQSQKKVIKYVGRCREVSEADSEKRAKTEPFVWRFHVAEGNPVTIQDVVRGEVTMSREVLGDFVVFRSSGIPVFLFANAVDDTLMEMTHVIRGEDHLSNTFRQALLFETMGWKVPIFVHLPMIGASDGGKFSKRAGSLSIRNLREAGFIPAGLVNYLALLGWSPGDTAETGEKFTKEELIQRFDLSRIHKGRALFDEQKLKFLNHSHLNDLSFEELLKLAPAKQDQWRAIWPEAVQLIRHDCATLNEIYKIESFLSRPEYEKSTESKEWLQKVDSKKVLQGGLERLKKKLDSGTTVDEALKASISEVGAEVGIKGKNLFFPFRIALTASGSGPELVPLAKVIGPQEVRARLEAAIQFAA